MSHVALDPSATVAADAVNLLVDRVGQSRPGAQAGGRQVSARVTTTARSALLTCGSAGVTLEPADPAASGDHADGGAALRLPAGALIRLVYGTRPRSPPPVEATQVNLDDLRQIFPDSDRQRY
jgi:hypothetical protein